MTQADKQYNELVKDISRNGSWNKDQDIRAKYADGIPAYAKSIFGKQIEFRNGLMPLVTGKKVFTTTATKEMMLFWVLQTIQEKDFKDAKVKIWDEWFKNGNLGRSYAYQFESHRHHIREIIKVKPRIKEHHGELKSIILESKDEVNLSCSDENVGKTIESKNYGSFQVLDVFPSGVYFDGIQAFKIKFSNTNAVRIVRKYDALKGEVQDFFVRNIRGVGYLGNHKSVRNYTDDQMKKLYVVWENMLSRCYKNDNYGRYKDNGIFVDERWHSFENFLRDIRWIPQFFLAKENNFEGWSIDKDYYGSNSYSIDTTVWLTQKENKWYRNISKPFYAMDKDGNRKLFLTTTECAKDLGLANSAPITSCLNKKPHRKSAAGHTFEYLQDNEHLYRYELSRNQVVDLINGIKNNPSSNRLLTSFWNHADVDKKALQECAHMTNWNVREGKLDLILIQRSADIGLGVCFNWIQYWILLQMISHVCGLEPGDFVHQVANIHYYDRHENILMEQLKNPIYEEPIFHINKDVQDFFDFIPSDIKFEGYQSGPYMHMEVAI